MFTLLEADWSRHMHVHVRAFLAGSASRSHYNYLFFPKIKPKPPFYRGHSNYHYQKVERGVGGSHRTPVQRQTDRREERVKWHSCCVSFLSTPCHLLQKSAWAAFLL